jgi:CRISPR-associated protein Csx17
VDTSPRLALTIRHYQVSALDGLAPGPMGAWLASVGLLRAASRLDASARLYWLDTGRPVLTAGTDVIAAIADSAEWRYQTAITPWQSGGGWGPKDKTPRDRITRLEDHRSPRLSLYRPAIQAADRVLHQHPGASKNDIVRHLRNWLPDEALPWLDAAVPLRSAVEGDRILAVGWAPLAGTGGNDARWDISTNYHAALLDLEPRGAQEEAGARRRRSLNDLLAGTENEPLAEMSAGLYWPGSAGLLNPWAMVLLVEGLCAFGDSGHIHPSGDSGQPWTAQAGPDIAGEPGLGEAWLPMWTSPMSIGEVRVILATRPQWRGRPAVRATDMYASMHTAGWPGGVTGFLRYGITRRRGQAHAAVLLDAAFPASPEEMLTTAQAADRAGIAPRTWSAYVARGQAPAPDERDPRTGRPLWLPSTVETWLETRPGQGARTDRPKITETTGEAS